VDLDVRRQQRRLHWRVLGFSFSRLFEWRVRLGKWRRRQRRADQRALHNWFGLRRQRERPLELELRRIDRRLRWVMLGAFHIRLQRPDQRSFAF
jgi:hypothetical protein